MNHTYLTAQNHNRAESAATTNHFVWFYIVVGSLLISQAIYTVYHGGLVVGNGYRISQLEKQKRELLSEKTQIQQQLAENYSLVNIQASEMYKQFQPMASVITVETTHTVASR